MGKKNPAGFEASGTEMTFKLVPRQPDSYKEGALEGDGG
jgi:hypothetical protein